MRSALPGVPRSLPPEVSALDGQVPSHRLPAAVRFRTNRFVHSCSARR